MVKPIVYLSACIEHDMCRYDGQFIASEYVRKMKDFVTFKTVCPELAIGLGAPRESIRLVKRDTDDEVKLLGSHSGNDVTEKMKNFTSKYIQSIQDKDIDGFILKSKSPTCGTKQVKLYKDIGKAHLIHAKNEGMFGGAIVHAFPTHPVEHDKRLTNDQIREHFLINIYTRARFREVTRIKELVAFHSYNKYLFMVYNQAALKRMGNIVANHDHLPFHEVMEKYKAEMVHCLKQMPNRRKTTNTLTHLYGYFKKEVSQKEKENFMKQLDRYQENLLPISAILQMLHAWVIRFENEYLANQTIFEPFPIELTVFE